MTRKQFMLFFIGVLVITAILLITVFTDEKKMFEKDVSAYLSEQGYDVDKDIRQLSIVNIGDDASTFAAIVTFDDKSDKYYVYAYEYGTKKMILLDEIDKPQAAVPEAEEEE